MRTVFCINTQKTLRMSNQGSERGIGAGSLDVTSHHGTDSPILVEPLFLLASSHRQHRGPYCGSAVPKRSRAAAVVMGL